MKLMLGLLAELQRQGWQYENHGGREPWELQQTARLFYQIPRKTSPYSRLN